MHHVLEDDVKQAIPREVSDAEIGPMELVLDAPPSCQRAVSARVRAREATSSS